MLYHYHYFNLQPLANFLWNKQLNLEFLKISNHFMKIHNNQFKIASRTFLTAISLRAG